MTSLSLLKMEIHQDMNKSGGITSPLGSPGILHSVITTPSLSQLLHTPQQKDFRRPRPEIYSRPFSRVKTGINISSFDTRMIGSKTSPSTTIHAVIETSHFRKNLSTSNVSIMATSTELSASPSSTSTSASPCSSFSSLASGRSASLKPILKKGPCLQVVFQDAEHSALGDDEDYWGDEVHDGELEDNQSKTGSIEEEGFGDDEAESVYSDNNSDEDSEITEDYSFISFGHSVRFNSNIDCVVFHDIHHEGDSNDDLEVTFHEKMRLSESSKRSSSDKCMPVDSIFDPTEHTRDVVELDKRLLMAYINGLRTINTDDYKPVLRSRTLHGRPDGINLQSIDSLEDVNIYLDRALELVLGFFPNLFTPEEYDDLLDHAEIATSFDDYNHVIYGPESTVFQQKIEMLLSERLANETTIIEKEILDFFAGEIIEPLGRRALLR